MISIYLPHLAAIQSAFEIVVTGWDWFITNLIASFNRNILLLSNMPLVAASDMADKTFDYIVIGAGVSLSTLKSNLCIIYSVTIRLLA